MFVTVASERNVFNVLAVWHKSLLEKTSVLLTNVPK